MSVAKEVTSALSYLHTGCDSVLVHRDVKRLGMLSFNARVSKPI